MATVKNKKKSPLSVDEVKEKFRDGACVHECHKGVCLISRTETSDEFWWAELSAILGDANLESFFKQKIEPDMPDWNVRRVEIFDKINKQLWNIDPSEHP